MASPLNETVRLNVGNIWTVEITEEHQDSGRFQWLKLRYIKLRWEK
jgi:hypothetical protein